MKHSIRVQALAAIALCCALSGCAANAANHEPSPQQSSVAPGGQAEKIKTGTSGAAHFDHDYIEIGHGATIVDFYFDPMCPYCRLFEEQNLPLLTDEVARGSVTLRLHPVAMLNRLSNGSNYSTRASAALVDVAANGPAKVLPFLEALYANQPAEGSNGLSDKELQDMKRSVGLRGRATPADIRAWVDARTNEALTGPVDTTAELKTIQQVPTVIVNGHVFSGDPSAFRTFLGARS